MDAQPFDPRSWQAWWQAPDAYHVEFWRPLGHLHPRPLGIGVMFESSEWLLTDVHDVAEVIGWADANADGRTYTLGAVFERGKERGVIELRGVNPTRDRVGWNSHAEVRRLFAVHGYTGEVMMVPVWKVDERVFVLAPEELDALNAPDELIASLEAYLEAPVRLLPSTTIDAESS